MVGYNENLIVIIPAYEPPREFIDYAREVAGYCKRLVVVNDGSNESFNGVFEEIAAIENVDYLTYGENHGKGYALKHAFRHCVDSFCPDDVIVTADCDGQHKIKDVLGVYSVACEHPDALILGSRDFREKCVPPRSRFGNTFTRRLYKLLYGLKLYDTQTGLRGFTVALAERFLGVRGDRFEYELGQLIYAKRNGINTFETPIETVYPENPEDHVSHFRSIRDSARVMGVMLSNLGVYLLSSIISAIVDVGVFYLISAVILTREVWYYTLIATLSARVISSIVNFTLNRKYVFNGMEKRSVFRYYVLWTVQLCASFGIASIFSQCFGMWGWRLTICKGAGDLLLALISYQVQRVWVFAPHDPHKLWGCGIGVIRALATLFSTEYRCNVIPKGEPVLYVARHLNMHGPFTTIKWLSFDFHPMIFSVFFKQSTCYRQYRDYTFSVREGKSGGRFSLRAWLYSLAVPGLVKGVRGIPVYRDKCSALTFKESLEVMQRGESVMVYADVDYTAGADVESELYSGFLYLGDYYRRKTGRSLKIVPLYIDEEKKSINEGAPVIVDDYKTDSASALEYLQAAVNGRAE